MTDTEVIIKIVNKSGDDWEFTKQEARIVYEQLRELVGDKHGLPNYPAGCRDFDPIPPVTCADTGRTVWATDGDGNSISPDELNVYRRT